VGAHAWDTVNGFSLPDTIETLNEAGLNERDALVEIACGLFDAGKLTLWSAARVAQLTRVEFEQELRARRIALYRPTPADLQADLEALDQLGIGPCPSS